MWDFFKEVSCWSQYSSRNMVFQLEEETWLDNQEIQGAILCQTGCPEETVSWTPSLIFSILKAMILILQRIWRHYQSKTRKNTSRKWLMKFKFLWEGTHGRFLKKVNCWSQCASRNMVFQVQEETWLNNYEIQGTILCERGYPEAIVS